jgi:nicotinamide-nucleotide amidase
MNTRDRTPAAADCSDDALRRLTSRLGRRLLESQRFVTTAESCTGGWIAKALTDIAGSSQWFAEGFVTYGNTAKMRTLGVAAGSLETAGAVSEAVVKQMAKGALERSGAAIAVAVSGIAGPGGAVPGKPVGTVWFCWAVLRGARVRVSTASRRFRGDRDAVRRKTVRVALQGLLTR